MGDERHAQDGRGGRVEVEEEEGVDAGATEPIGTEETSGDVVATLAYDILTHSQLNLMNTIWRSFFNFYQYSRLKLNNFYQYKYDIN